jgi:hypothetical protein
MKKLLFIDSRKGSDFTLDALWSGLVDVLGNGTVTDWPAADKHREGIPVITGDVERDYGAERRGMCYTEHGQWKRRYNRDELVKLIHENQIGAVVVDEREESFIEYLKLPLRYSKIPVVVVAGHDRFWNVNPSRPWDQLRNWYGENLRSLFIDNWRQEYDHLQNTYPMAYSTNFDHLWDHAEREELLKNKKYDIFFMGYNSDPTRTIIVDELIKRYRLDNNKLFVETRPDIMNSFLPKKEYFKLMAQSRVCINLNGAAECKKTLRFYEIPYVGSYMLSQRDSARQINPMIDDVHCHYFSTKEQLFDRIDWALAFPEKREMIAARGHYHAMEFNTNIARASYVLSKSELTKDLL